MNFERLEEIETDLRGLYQIHAEYDIDRLEDKLDATIQRMIALVGELKLEWK